MVRLDLADPAAEPFWAPAPGASAVMPEALTRWLREIPSDIRGQARYVMAAGLMTAYYLGPERFEVDDDTFLRGDEAVEERQLASRLVATAEALFLLRAQPAFAGLCERLGATDLLNAFFELTIARRFAEAGFTIAASRDFAADRIIAQRGSEQIALITMCLRNARFKAPAVRESLDEAGARLPAGPAFLGCLYPCRWRLDCWDLDFALGGVASGFLATAPKINQIGFYHEEFTWSGAGGTHMLAGFTEANAAPAAPFPELAAMLRPAPLSDDASSGAAEPCPPKFFAYVDWALASLENKREDAAAY
jgi:hypothetical protein